MSFVAAGNAPATTSAASIQFFWSAFAVRAKVDMASPLWYTKTHHGALNLCLAVCLHVVFRVAYLRGTQLLSNLLFVVSRGPALCNASFCIESGLVHHSSR